MDWLNWVSLVQGAYFAISGLWPLVHMSSFERVTGPKLEHWLVRTVGILVTVIGGVLVFAALYGGVPPEAVALGMGSAAALAGVDLNYFMKGRIARVYLLDAGVEAVLIAAWIVAVVVAD